VRAQTFSSRVVPVWNSLPNDVILAESLSLFKLKLNKVDLSRHLCRNHNAVESL
jgi:hypothetical protein